MTTRTVQSFVAFAHPFALPGVDAPLRPGRYLVETDEESIDAASRLAWRRVATTIRVESDGATQVIAISPLELERLLLADQRGPAG